MTALSHARRIGRWLTAPLGISRAAQSYRARILVQASFALGCTVLGFQFSRFYLAALASKEPLPDRPAGVEGFLPISGLMGALDWIYQGTLNTIHPAATMLFLLFVAISLLLRKAFCSWICPVGFLSESLARLGRLGFGRNFRIWKWLDIPLRGLKYLLLGFFIWAIFTMGKGELREFIDSPYNRVSDIKMGLFFVQIGLVGAVVMGFLVLASIFVNGAWCRYLCPYGGLLGLFSWMSPVKVRRDLDSCIDCRSCDDVCMARLPVSRKDAVMSVECTGCLDCLASCPVDETLTIGTSRRRFGVVPFALGVVCLFFAGYIGARATGLWDNAISDQEYIQRVNELESGSVGYGHPGMSNP